MTFYDPQRNRLLNEANKLLKRIADTLDEMQKSQSEMYHSLFTSSGDEEKLVEKSKEVED